MKKYITSKPDVMGGAPCIVGTRIPMAVIVARLKDGYTLEAIHEGYPWVPIKNLEGAVNELVDRLSSTKDAAEILQTQTTLG